jgi:signal peptidase I
MKAIVINRLVYHFEPIHRGDVVVFRYPLDATQFFIKRIVGLPGETVQIWGRFDLCQWELDS